MIAGIDPGIFGGVAWLSEDDKGVVPMPILAGQIDLDVFGAVLRDKKPSIVIIEKASVRPKESASSALTAGMNHGMLVGYISAMGLPIDTISPQEWKKGLGLTKTQGQTPQEGKERSILLASQLFPDVELKRTPKCRVKSDGLAEALLIAEHGRRKHAR